MTASAAAVVGAEPDLIVRREGSAGVIRLNRPKAINAMTLEMSLGIDAALDRFEADPAVALVLLEGAGERGLCAGGDIRGLYESSRAGGDLGKVFWRQEYIMNARIAKFPKPYVAFMDGLVMGGGVGLSAHGRHRVVTERTKLAMPEVGLGLFSRCRRHLAVVALARRDRHLFRIDRPDHERSRCDPCPLCRRGRAVGQIACLARGPDQGSPRHDVQRNSSA